MSDFKFMDVAQRITRSQGSFWYLCNFFSKSELLLNYYFCCQRSAAPKNLLRVNTRSFYHRNNNRTGLYFTRLFAAPRNGKECKGRLQSGERGREKRVQQRRRADEAGGETDRFQGLGKSRREDINETRRDGMKQR
jgi:hypothetical protein